MDAGSALVEFVGASVVLLLPLVYLLLTVFAVQRAAFAVTDGARNAGRALTVAGSTVAGRAQAQLAARLALADQGVAGRFQLSYTGGGCGPEVPTVVPTLTPGARYSVCLRVRVPLPFTGDRVLGRIAPATVGVLGSYLLVVDPYRAVR